MKVAYVCTDPGVPVFGNKGCSIHVQEVIRAMLRRGYEVDLFARRVEGERSTDLQCVRLITLDRPVCCPDTASREKRLVDLDRPLRIELQRRGPYDLVYERYALWSSAAMRYAMEAEVDSILEINTPLVREQSRHRDLADTATATTISTVAFAAANTLLAVSRNVADYIESFGIADARRILVQPNGVDPGRFALARVTVQQRQQNRLESDFDRPFIVGFTGTLRPWHGMSVLGRAFRQFHARHRSSQLLIVGDGPSRQELFESLGPQAARATTITGKIDHAAVPGQLARMDVAVAPYPSLPDFYFSPLKLFEYMACGLPIVVSRIGDIPAYVQDHWNGLLIRPGDAASLAGALSEIHDDVVFARLLGRRAANVVGARHTWDHVMDNVIRHAGCGGRNIVAISGARSAG